MYPLWYWQGAWHQTLTGCSRGPFLQTNKSLILWSKYAWSNKVWCQLKWIIGVSVGVNLTLLGVCYINSFPAGTELEEWYYGAKCHRQRSQYWYNTTTAEGGRGSLLGMTITVGGHSSYLKTFLDFDALKLLKWLASTTKPWESYVEIQWPPWAKSAKKLTRNACPWLLAVEVHYFFALEIRNFSTKSKRKNQASETCDMKSFSRFLRDCCSLRPGNFSNGLTARQVFINILHISRRAYCTKDIKRWQTQICSNV